MRPPRSPFRCATPLRVVLVTVLAAAGSRTVYGYTAPNAPQGRDAISARPEEGILLGPFILIPSLYTDVTFDDNVFRVEDGFQLEADPDNDGTLQLVTQESQGDFISTTRANVGLKLPFSHSFVSLLFTPQYRTYQDLDAPLKYSHALLFDSALNFANGSSLKLQDDRAHGFFQARLLDAEAKFELNSTPYQRVRTTLMYDWAFANTWGLNGKAERIQYEYDATEFVSFSDQVTGTGGTTDRLFNFFDYETKYFQGGAYRNFAHVQLFFAGSVARTDQDRSKFNETQRTQAGCDEETPENPETCARLAALPDAERIEQADVSVGVRGEFSSRSLGDFKVGYSAWDFQSGSPEPFRGISVEGNFQHTFDRRTISFINLQRVPVQATGQYTGYYIREEASFSLERRLTMNLASRGLVTYRRSHFPGVPELQQPRFALTDYELTLEMRYRPGSAMRPGPVLFVLGYSPSISTSDLPNSGLDVNTQRATLSLQWGWF